MGAAVLDILTPSVVTDIISTIYQPGACLSRYLDMQIGGRRVKQVPGRTYTYDQLDFTRAVARGRTANAPAGTVPAQPIGNVAVTLGRAAEKLPLNYNDMLQIRTLGANAGVYDRMGKRYVDEQAKILRMRQDNFSEFIVSGLMNGGKYGFWRSGDDLIPTLNTSADIVVDHRIPSSNLLVGGSFAAGLTLNSGGNLITGNWSSSNTILTQLLNIEKAFVANVGVPLKTIFLNNSVWTSVLNDTSVKGVAGTSNTPFAQYDNIGQKNPDGTDAGVFRAVLKGLPQFEFVIVNNVIDIATSDASTIASVPAIADNYVVFCADLSLEYMSVVEGSQIIKDNDLAPAVERQGFYAYVLEKADPARFEMHTDRLVGIEITRPKAIAYARVQ